MEAPVPEFRPAEGIPTVGELKSAWEEAKKPLKYLDDLKMWHDGVKDLGARIERDIEHPRQLLRDLITPKYTPEEQRMRNKAKLDYYGPPTQAPAPGPTPSPAPGPPDLPVISPSNDHTFPVINISMPAPMAVPRGPGSRTEAPRIHPKRHHKPRKHYTDKRHRK